MAELVNKINGPWFSKFDEDLATAFSIYCGISIAHVRRHLALDLGGILHSAYHWLSLPYPEGWAQEVCCWRLVQPSTPAARFWTQCPT